MGLKSVCQINLKAISKLIKINVNYLVKFLLLKIYSKYLDS